jgi:type II secretory pathway pseudopilin PulG
MALRRCPRRRAFTLIEAMVAMTITVMAGSAVLLGIATSIKATDDLLARTQAAGIAEQMMDEIAGQLYCQDTALPQQYPLGPAAGETRQLFNDIDDYTGLVTQPPKDRYSIALGTEDRNGGQRDPKFRVDANTFANWELSVLVYYVDPANPAQALAAGLTSTSRAVEVTVNLKVPQQGTRTLAKSRRVFSYVPIQ